MKLQDLAIGECGTLVERIEHEVRWTVYERREGDVRYPTNVAVYRVKVLQGVLGEEPRFARDSASRYPSEANALTPIEPTREWPIKPPEPTGDGFVLVPLEPTKPMLRAASKAMSPQHRPTQTHVSVNEKHRIRYAAMVAARPQ